MVIGDVNYGDPTVHAPRWHVLEYPTALMGHCVPVSGVTCRGNTGAVSPFVLGEAALAALRRSLAPPRLRRRRQQYVDESYDSSSSSLSSEEGEEEEEEEEWEVYASTDDFRMYEFKVRACRRRRSHNWTECPFAHPGEKAARRDPRRFTYSGEPCPEFRRRGACERGDACDLAHGVFECWLHPARYRTQPCKDGTACRRPVCFFAHTLAQLRLPLPLPPHHTTCSRSRRRSMKEKRIFSSSLPTSPAFYPAGSSDIREKVEAAMAELRLCKSMPSSWKHRCNAAGFESTGTGTSSNSSVPSTIVMTPEHQYSWCAEDSVDEDSAAAEESAAAEMSAPNFDWVSDLLK